MRNVLKVEIYALELKYFKDTTGMEILVPTIHGGESPPPPSPPPPTWIWETFREDAEKRVDEDTLKTMDQLHEFSHQIGRVDFDSGKVYSNSRYYTRTVSSTFTWYDQTLREAGSVLKRCSRKA